MGAGCSSEKAAAISQNPPVEHVKSAQPNKEITVAVTAPVPRPPAASAPSKDDLEDEQPKTSNKKDNTAPLEALPSKDDLEDEQPKTSDNIDNTAPLEALQRCFEAHDKDKSGSIDFEEPKRNRLKPGVNMTAPVKAIMVSEGLTTLNITPDGTTLIAADKDNKIHLFDVTTGTCIATFDGIRRGGLYPMFHLNPSPDGLQVVCGSGHTSVWVFDLETRKRAAVLSGHMGVVTCAVFSASGGEVVACSTDKLVKVHDIATSTCIATFRDHSASINHIAISPNGTRIASCADDGVIVIHDLTDTSEPPVKLQPQRARCVCVAWHPTLPDIAIGSSNHTVQVIDAETGAVQVTFKGHLDWVTCLGWHPTGRLLVSGCNRGQIRLWSPVGRACVAVLPPTPGCAPETRHVRGTVFTPDGRTLFTGCGRVILKWSVEPFMNAVKLVEAAAEKRAAAIANAFDSVDDEAGGSLNGAVAGWLSAHFEGSNAVCDELWPAQSQGLYSVSLSPDGRMVAAASKDCTARLFDVSQPGTPCITLSGEFSVVTCVATAPDASFAVTGGEDGVLLLHRLPAGICARRLSGHESQTITCAVISPDGSLVASGSRDKGLLFLHDVKDLTTVDSKGLTGRRLMGHSDTIWTVAFAPDASRRLASCGQDGTIRFWSLDSDQAEATIHQEKPFNAIAYSSDACRLFAADDTNIISIYDIASQQRLMEFHNPNSYVSSVKSLAVSLDGTILASFTTGAIPGSTDTIEEQLVRLWDITTGAPIGMLPHPQQVTGVAFGPQSLVTACWDGRVRTFSLDALTNWEDGGASGAGQEGDGSGTGGKAGGGSFWPMRLPLRLHCDTPVAVLSGPHTDLVWSLAFSPNSKLLLTTSRAGMVQLTHVGTKWAAAATLDYDMPAAATSTEGGGDGADVGVLTNDHFSTASVFSPNGRMIAAAGGVDPVVRLWLLQSPNTTLQAQCLALGGHKGQVLAVTFSPDCRTLVSAGADTQVLLHDLSALKPGGAASPTSTTASLAISVALKGHTSAVLSLAFHPDGNLLAASGEDSSILVFSVLEHAVQLKVQVPGYACMAACLRFSPSGHLLAACTVDGTVFLYNSGDGSHVAVLPCSATSAATEHHRPIVETPPNKLDSARAGVNVTLVNDDFTVAYAANCTGVGTVLANFPAPANALLYYYEVTILSRGAEGRIGVGFAKDSYPLDAMPGCLFKSCGYVGADGKYHCESSHGEAYGPTFSTGDVIGVGLLFQSHEVFYTKNGVQLDFVRAHGITSMYPAIGLQSEGEKVYVNFGQDPFVFDLEAFKANIKANPHWRMPGVPVTAENARPGLVVVRGADWERGDEDGGAGKIGVMTKPSATRGEYWVTWDNGGSKSYRIGKDGKHDLQTSGGVLTGDLIKGSPVKAGEVVKRSNAAEGMRVVRGPNWKWGDQDGWPGNVGKIVLVKTNGWARVEWEHNKSRSEYRIGAEDSHDLQVAIPMVSKGKLSNGADLQLKCKMGRLVFAPGGNFLIASAPDKLLRVWRLDGVGRDMRSYCVAQLEGIKAPVSSLDITRDYLAVSSMDGAVTVYDVAALLSR